MSIRASVLNKSIRPRRKSLTRGWLMRHLFANSAWVRRLDSISFWTLIIKSARTSKCSASPAVNPTSRKTLPVDRVILSFIVTLPSVRYFAASSLDQRSKTVSGEVCISFRSFSRALFKGVQDINALGKLHHIENSMFKIGMDADLVHTDANSGHWLPIIRLKPLLDTAQLESGNAARVFREHPQIASGRPEPDQRFIHHGKICGY